MGNKKKKINLYIDEEMFNWIKKGAENEDRSLNKFVKIMVKYFMDHPEISGFDSFLDSP